MNESQKKAFLIFILAFLFAFKGGISSAQIFQEKIILIPPVAGNVTIINFSDEIKKLIENENFFRAQELLNSAVAREPNNSEIYSLNAIIFYRKSKFEDAEVLAQRAIELNKKNTDAYLVLGNIYLIYAKDSVSKEEKISLLKQSSINFGLAAMYNPALPDTYIGLAQVYFEQGKSSKALDELLKAQELDIYNPYTLYSIGEFYYNLSNYAKALRYLIKSTELNTKNDYKTHYLMANIYEKLGDSDNAKEEYRILLSVNPNDEIETRLKELVIQTTPTANTDKKEKNIALKKLSDNLDLLTQADNYLLNDRYLEARDLYRQILHDTPENTGAIAGLLEMYHAQYMTGFFNGKYYLEDSAHIEKAKSDRLIIPLIKFNLIGEQGFPPEILNEIKSIAYVESSTYTALLNSARALHILGEYRESHEKVDILLSSKLARNEMLRIAKFLYLDHNYNEAEKAAKSIKSSEYSKNVNLILNRISNKREYVENMFNQGLTLYRKKKYQEAATKLEETIKYLPTHNVSHLYYSYTLKKLNLLNKAISELKTYHELNELYPPLIAKLSQKKAEDLIKKWEEQQIKMPKS